MHHYKQLTTKDLSPLIFIKYPVGLEIGYGGGEGFNIFS